MTSELVVFGVSSDVVVSKSFAEAAANLQEAIQDVSPSKAFSTVDGALMSGLQHTQGSLLYTIHAIGLAKSIWDKLDASERDVIADTFYQYVSSRFGVSQSSSTVDNYIRVARAWLLEDTRLDVPNVRTSVTVKDGEVELGNKEVATNVWDVPYSKLLVATVKATREEMKEEDWGMLFESNVSQGQLIDYWRGPKGTHETPNALTYAVYAGHLCAVRGKEIEDMSEIDVFSINNNSLAAEGWQQLMSVLKVDMLDDSLVLASIEEVLSEDMEEDF